MSVAVTNVLADVPAERVATLTIVYWGGGVNIVKQPVNIAAFLDRYRGADIEMRDSKWCSTQSHPEDYVAFILELRP